MGACICCYSEGARVGKVLDAFAGQRTRDAKDGFLTKIVGRVTLAGNSPFYAPVTGKPCVYFKTTVREERIEVRYYRDNNGYMRRSVYNVWQVPYKVVQRSVHFLHNTFEQVHV